LVITSINTQSSYFAREFINTAAHQEVETASLHELIITEQASGFSADDPYIVKTFLDPQGKQIEEINVPGVSPRPTTSVSSMPEPNIAQGINTLVNVPAFDWAYGCSATSAAMLFGYYDNFDYPDIYTGATNGGVIPLNNSVWGAGESPLSATHLGIDGRALKGHVDDYWIGYGNTDPDPFTGNWTEHTQADCTGDFMGTNQSAFGNSDGSTTFFNYTDGNPLYDYTACEPSQRDGSHGMRLYAESRGYTVITNYSQRIKGQGTNPDLGFTFSDFQNEIDAGRPVFIQVTGHSMLGYGYDTAGNTIYIHDTWDYSDHQMTWGSTYSGMQHYGVSVIELQLEHPTVTVEASDVAIYDGDVGVDAFTVTAAFSEAMDNSQIPTLTFDPALGTTLINSGGAWSVGDTVYTWTYDIEDAGVAVDNVDATVDGGKDMAGNAQIPKTNTDYMDVDNNVQAAPDKPYNISPVNGSTGQSLAPSLKSSAFIDTNTDDTHKASKWQITTTSEDYTNTIYDSGIDNMNLTSILLPDNTHENNTIYYWRVCYQDSFGDWSEWSDETSFKTKIVVEKTISTAGGTVETPDQEIVIDIPQGALDASTEIVLTVSQPSELLEEPSGFRMCDTCFTIELDSTLNQEVTVTVKYTVADWDAADGNPDNLVLSRWNDDTKQWEALPTVVNIPEQTLTAATSRFSLWAVMYSKPSSNLWVILLGSILPLILGAAVFLVVKRRRSKITRDREMP